MTELTNLDWILQAGCTVQYVPGDFAHDGAMRRLGTDPLAAQVAAVLELDTVTDTALVNLDVVDASAQHHPREAVPFYGPGAETPTSSDTGYCVLLGAPD